MVFTCASFLSCAGTQTPEELSYSEQAEALFLEAEEALAEDNYLVASNLYMEVQDQYQLSSYAILSELRIGDVLFEQADYSQSARAYSQFLQLHPSHSAVPYARFRIGMSYFEEMPSDMFLLPPPEERELTSTREASSVLSSFIHDYQGSEDPQIADYLVESQRMYQIAIDRLAGHEIYLSEFYLQRDRPVASANHLLTLLEEYPDSTLVPRSLFLLARCYVELNDVNSALGALSQLIHEFPDHELSDEASNWATEHHLNIPPAHENRP